MTRTLRGVTFSHPRIVRPLQAAARLFESRHPDVRVVWEEHTLQAFEEVSLAVLTKRFDILAFDHPLLGSALRDDCLEDIAAQHPGLRDRLQKQSMGLSLDSYRVGERLYGVPFDGAVQVSAWQSTAFTEKPAPRTLNEYVEFSSQYGTAAVGLPLLPAHAGCTFLSVAASVSPLETDDVRFFLDPVRMTAAWHFLGKIVQHSNERSFTLDPIHLLDDMAAGGDIVYSPFVFGYGIYASSDAVHERLEFSDSLRVTDKPNRSLLGGAGIGVSRSSPHIELAAELVTFLVGDDVMTDIVTANHGQGGIRAGWKSPHDTAMEENFFASTKQAMGEGIVRPRFIGFADFLQAFGEEVVSTIRRSAPVEDFIRRTHDIFATHCEVDDRLEAIIGSQPNQGPSEQVPAGIPTDLPSIEILEGG